MARPDLAGVRRAYDTVAESYAALLPAVTAERPLDRALLAAFAEEVTARGAGPVLEAGCGTGRVTAHLAALGLAVTGVDLSSAMVAVARRDHPHLALAVGSLDALGVADRSLAGVVAWYSIIHTPPDLLPAVFRELARVLAPGAPLLVAFQAGDGAPQHLTRAYGHDISLPAYRLDPGAVAAGLAGAGLVVDATTIRRAVPPEPTDQAFLLGHRSPEGTDPEA